MSILSDVKTILSVLDTGFDAQILAEIKAVQSRAVEIGVYEFEDISIDPETDWPEFTDSQIIADLIVAYFTTSVRVVFNPPPMVSMMDALNRRIGLYEQAIMLERSGYTDEEPIE